MNNSKEFSFTTNNFLAIDFSQHDNEALMTHLDKDNPAT